MPTSYLHSFSTSNEILSSGAKKINPPLVRAIEELRIRLIRDYDRNFRLTDPLKLCYFADVFYQRLITALDRRSIGLSYLEISELTGIEQSKISAIITGEKLEGFATFTSRTIEGFGNVDKYSGTGLPTVKKTTNGRPKKDRAVIRSKQKMIECNTVGQSFFNSIFTQDEEVIQAFSNFIIHGNHLSEIKPPNLLCAIEKNRVLVSATIAEFKDYLNNICIKLQSWRAGLKPDELKVKQNLSTFIDDLRDLIDQFDLTIKWLDSIKDGHMGEYVGTDKMNDDLIQLKVIIVSLLYSCRPALDAFKPILRDLEKVCPNGFIIQRNRVAGF